MIDEIIHRWFQQIMFEAAKSIKQQAAATTGERLMDEYGPAKSFTVDVILRRVHIFGREIEAANKAGMKKMVNSLARDLQDAEKVIGPGARPGVRGVSRDNPVHTDDAKDSPSTEVESVAPGLRVLSPYEDWNTKENWGFK